MEFLTKELDKTFILSIVLTAILSSGLTYAWQSGLFNVHKTPQVHANVYVTIETAMGVEEILVGNVITDWGEQYTRDAFADGTANATEYIAIGNVSGTLTAKTSLDAEYDRQQGSVSKWIKNGDYSLNCTYKWTFTEDDVVLDGTALHTYISGNNAYAIANIDQTKFNTNDNCTILWVITYDGN